MLSQSEALTHLRLAASVAGLELEELVVPTDHDVVVNGLRLHYLDWGRSGRPPLLFLHGGCLTAHSWDLVCLALRSEYHCLAVDLRGHGDSEWSPIVDYGPDAHVGDLRGLIERLGLERPVLIGHSLGGLNAMLYASSAAPRLAGIVLVDVGPDPQPAGVQRIADFVMGSPASGSIEEFADRAQAFNPRRDPRLLRSSLQHNLRRLPDGSWTWKYDRRSLSAQYLATVRRSLADLRHHTETVSCPVLVIRGADSEALTDADATAFAAALPDGRLAEVENAGHTIQGDNPRGLTAVLADFLAQIR